ncbi:MAG: HAD family phosphatase [Candidatus Woesearchaeota archaeon]
MIKAVIFDMDGVIIDSEAIHLEADNEVLKEFGKSLSEKENLKYVGTCNEEFYSDMKKKFNLPISVEELVRRKVEIDIKLVGEKAKPILPTLELIKLLSKNKYKLALASSLATLQIESILRKLNLKKYFETIVSVDCVAKAKPSPEMFLKAANLLGVKNSDCIVIEDSDKGVMAAKAAGMKVIAVPNSYTKHHDLSKADLIVSSLGDVTLETIKNMG